MIDWNFCTADGLPPKIPNFIWASKVHYPMLCLTKIPSWHKRDVFWGSVANWKEFSDRKMRSVPTDHRERGSPSGALP